MEDQEKLKEDKFAIKCTKNYKSPYYRYRGDIVVIIKNSDLDELGYDENENDGFTYVPILYFLQMKTSVSNIVPFKLPFLKNGTEVYLEYLNSLDYFKRKRNEV